MPDRLTNRGLWRRRRLDRNLVFRRLFHGRDPETGDRWIWRDPGFVAQPARFVVQAGLAAVVMLVALIFVDSLSNAAIAAGLASSVVIIFINPSNRTARIRAVVGGHGLALLLGSAFSFFLFSMPVAAFLEGTDVFRNLAYASVVGLSVLLMAITNAEHPPAAATAIGMASREWEAAIFGSIIGAVFMLALIKLALRSHLRDL